MAAIEQLAIHFAMESNLLHKDSDEAQRQLNRESDQSDESEAEDEEVCGMLLLHSINHNYKCVRKFKIKC